MSATVTLAPWDSGDLPLLERLMGDPRMTEHLGGPESPDKLRKRQDRYEHLEGGEHMFKIVEVATGSAVGSVGFWTKEWRDEHVYEVGWMVVPGVPGPRLRGSGDRAGNRDRQARRQASPHARLPERSQRSVERDLPEARLRAPGRMRVRVSDGPLHELQRLAA
jgi:hypothetical protein